MGQKKATIQFWALKVAAENKWISMRSNYTYNVNFWFLGKGKKILQLFSRGPKDGSEKM